MHFSFTVLPRNDLFVLNLTHEARRVQFLSVQREQKSPARAAARNGGNTVVYAP